MPPAQFPAAFFKDSHRKGESMGNQLLLHSTAPLRPEILPDSLISDNSIPAKAGKFNFNFPEKNRHLPGFYTPNSRKRGGNPYTGSIPLRAEQKNCHVSSKTLYYLPVNP